MGFAAAASAVAAVVSAVASIKSGQAQSRAAQAQADAASYNAAVQRAQADQERMASRIEAADLKKQGEAIMSAQRARLGAAGVTSAGTPLLVEAETAREVENNVLRTMYGGDLRARALEQGATLSGMEAAGARRAASSAMTNAYIGAGASLLTGAAKMSGGWSFGSGGSNPAAFNKIPRSGIGER